MTKIILSTKRTKQRQLNTQLLKNDELLLSTSDLNLPLYLKL